MTNRNISLQRAEELKRDTLPYMEAKKDIIKGTDRTFRNRYMEQKEKLLSILGATDDEWDDWKWQLRNRTEDLDLLGELIHLSDE